MSYSIYKKLCKLNNVSSAEVSKATGISQQTLSAWKKGDYIPKTDKRRKIAEYFGVSLEFLDADIEIDEEIDCTEFYDKVKKYLEMEGFDSEQEIHNISDDERYVIKFRNALNSMSEEKKQLMKDNIDNMYKMLGIDPENL